jgi:hypothetical protein
LERVNPIYGKVEEASAGFNISIESALQMGFNHFRRAPGTFILYTVIFLIAIFFPVTGLILGGPLLVGFYLFTRHLQSGEEADFSLFFNSLQKFTSLLILNLLMTLVILLGFLFLIVPGIYFSISYLFAPLLVWFYDVSPGEAIALSRKMVSGHFMQILWIWLILLGINVLGGLAGGVGLLVTVPFSTCVIYAVFDDIIGIP